MTTTRDDHPIQISRRRLLAMTAGGAGLGYLGFRLLSRPDRFRFNTVEKPVPTVDPAAYTLTVQGAVDQPRTFTLDDLRALPSASQISDFRCVEGWGVDNVRWQGVRFSSIVDLVSPKSDAGFVTLYSEGGVYADSLTVAQATLPDVLLAYDMDEKPLTRDHGYPLRLVMPRMYGYKGPKWVNRIEFVRFRETGYWEKRGWGIDAWIT